MQLFNYFIIIMQIFLCSALEAQNAAQDVATIINVLKVSN